MAWPLPSPRLIAPPLSCRMRSLLLSSSPCIPTAHASNHLMQRALCTAISRIGHSRCVSLRSSPRDRTHLISHTLLLFPEAGGPFHCLKRGFGGAAQEGEEATTAEKPASSKPHAHDRTILTNFSHLTLPFKRFILRVHPDVVMSHGAEVVAVNETALQELFRLFDTLKTGYEALEPQNTQAQKRAGNLKARYDISFYVKVRGELDHAPLQQRNVALVVPASFEERINLLASRGLKAQARVHYLDMGRKIMQELLIAADINHILVLSDEDELMLNRATQSMKRRGAESGSHDAVVGAAAALRANLVELSPLVQGKTADKASVAGVFSAPEKRARVLRLLSSGLLAPAAGLTKEQCRVGMNALRKLLYDNFERLQVYDSIWEGVRLTISTEFFVDAAGGILHVPYNVNEASFLGFFDDAFPKIVRLAKQYVPRRLAEYKRRNPGAPIDFHSRHHESAPKSQERYA